MEVLSVLPLRLIEGLDGDEEARPWMLPLLKKYVQRTSLECWGSELLPLGRALGNRAASLQQAGRGQRAMLCLTLERQIWNTLPSFCIWPKDGDVAYRKHVETIGIAFQKRQELRPPICHALVRLCAQSHTILKDSREGAGFCDLPGVVVEALGSMGDPELDAGSPPSYFTVEVAKRLVVSLREHSAHWLQALYTVFVETQPRDRAPIVQALTAYAAICEPRILGDFFRMVITKLIQNLKNEDDVSGEGGSEADQMLARSTFMELALCIAAGLDDTGITTLYKVAKQGLQDKDAAVQKKGYKLLAYITNERKHFLLQNFQDVVGTVLGGGSTCLSPAKRFRLQCLNPIIVAAMAKSASGTTQTAIDDGSDEVMDGMADNKGFVQVVDALLTEIILCIKEKNAKARDQAYEVLVNLGRMHKDAGPFTLPQLVTQLLAGLAGTTPHMMSATTCALSRMVYEFSSDLELLVPQILELVLRLLQTKSREVVASVLGFVQVCTRRLPVATLTDHLPLIIDAILLWGNDPKNKFRMKVRTIITRLAVRCGFEEVERLIPEDYSKPFANIRKGQLRKKKKQADDEDDEDDGVDGTYTDGHGGGLAKTALRSEWDHSRIFSEGKDGRSSDVSKNAKSKKSSAWKAFGRLPETGAGGDPLDLLNASTSRQLAKVGAGMAADGAVNPEQDSDDMDLPADPEGRLIINENTLKGKRRGKREREDDSSSSEGDDDRKSAFTMGRTSKRSTAVASGRRSAKSSIHGGDRFRAKKGAGGDVKSKGGVEPYAYWRFDHKLLNRRRGKKALGKNDLKRILRKGGRRGRAKRARNE
ncbi:unnamed protein product [Ostreobium quekettii]|uniref:RRP12 HEAT domain-containing protein n=1 Tax=Ostreobium quekettii TaxID=121088 RepID=A0A8S1IYF9_9CHLO|nr:unnamed protein product [Ostreobium quekettii]